MSEDIRPVVAGPSHTIAEFCRLEGISLSFFYKLQRQGMGPRTFHLGRAHRISEEARTDWRRNLERAYKEKQKKGDISTEQIGGAQ